MSHLSLSSPSLFFPYTLFGFYVSLVFFVQSLSPYFNTQHYTGYNKISVTLLQFYLRIKVSTLNGHKLDCTCQTSRCVLVFFISKSRSSRLEKTYLYSFVYDKSHWCVGSSSDDKYGPCWYIFLFRRLFQTFIDFTTIYRNVKIE